MNTERLHLVVRAVKDELDSLDVVASLGLLRQGLEGLANNPADATAQQQVSDARNQLAAQLSRARSDSWPPSERQVLEQLGVEDVLGSALRERIEEILGRNEITPSVARDEIIVIHDRLVQVNAQLEGLLGALEFFGIGQDELVDEVEVAVSIPRPAVHNALGELGDEFSKLRKILAPFQELALASRPDVEVRSVSSSDFSVFVAAAPAWAWLLAKGVHEIVEIYNGILDIKLKRDELASRNQVPETVLEPLEQYLNSLMGERIETLAEGLVEEEANPALDEARKNELKIEIAKSLNALANRVDRGYSVDLRTPEPPDETTETDGEEPDTQAQQLNAIRQMAADMRFLQQSNTPILELPESLDESDEQEPGEPNP